MSFEPESNQRQMDFYNHYSPLLYQLSYRRRWGESLQNRYLYSPHHLQDTALSRLETCLWFSQRKSSETHPLHQKTRHPRPCTSKGKLTELNFVSIVPNGMKQAYRSTGIPNGLLGEIDRLGHCLTVFFNFALFFDFTLNNLATVIVIPWTCQWGIGCQNSVGDHKLGTFTRSSKRSKIQILIWITIHTGEVV